MKDLHLQEESIFADVERLFCNEVHSPCSGKTIFSLVKETVARYGMLSEKISVADYLPAIYTKPGTLLLAACLFWEMLCRCEGEPGLLCHANGEKLLLTYSLKVSEILPNRTAEDTLREACRWGRGMEIALEKLREAKFFPAFRLEGDGVVAEFSADRLRLGQMQLSALDNPLFAMRVQALFAGIGRLDAALRQEP